MSESIKALRRVQELLLLSVDEVDGDDKERRQFPYAAGRSHEAQLAQELLPGPENCPVAQAVQVDASAMLNVPEGQREQVFEPASAYFPSEQERQAELPEKEYLPPTHAVQPFELAEFENVPEGQSEQTPCPSSEYLPALHGVQAEAAEGEKEPAGHGLQRKGFMPLCSRPGLEKVPAGQMAQLLGATSALPGKQTKPSSVG